jgi:hypothetical protein
MNKEFEQSMFFIFLNSFSKKKHMILNLKRVIFYYFFISFGFKININKDERGDVLDIFTIIL